MKKRSKHGGRQAGRQADRRTDGLVSSHAHAHASAGALLLQGARKQALPHAFHGFFSCSEEANRSHSSTRERGRRGRGHQRLTWTFVMGTSSFFCLMEAAKLSVMVPPSSVAASLSLSLSLSPSPLSRPRVVLALFLLREMRRCLSAPGRRRNRHFRVEMLVGNFHSFFRNGTGRPRRPLGGSGLSEREAE